jgi:S1-C subfamily serine protease
MRQPCGALLSTLPANLRRIMALGMLVVPIAAATAESLAQSPATPTVEAEILGSIVSISVRAVANARTARDQGAERQGTGVVVEPGGYILTSVFLVQEADSIVVTTADARTVRAAVAAQDETTGVAVLRPAAGLGVRPLPLGSAATVGVPAPAIIASAAKGRRIAAASVVAKREFAGHWEYLVEDALLTTPPTPEWSGAALVDGTGRLIGIGSLLLADVKPGAEPATPGNLFIPVEGFRPVLARLAAGDTKQSPRRPWLGLVMAKSDRPLVIAEVPPGSPAERAGLRPGDMVAAVNGDAVATHAELYRRIWREQPGTDIVLSIRRDGALREVRLRAIDPQDYLIHRASR